MACKTSFELHHHFPKLAEESGFTFNTHRPRIHIDWNKIKLIDIESLIKERKFSVIEQHLNDILDCVFESEFDVRILDEGVMKMFRLAQLAVEYQQFCRHYLDRSVYVLREEITSLAQELDTCKKELREKDDEIRRLRKRSRHSFKNTLPYGNDNIATMILKTLTQKGDSVFTSPINDSFMQYNKCDYCDKVFLNQLYLKSHMSRRHANIVEPPQNDKDCTNNENSKLSAEVTDLKNKIKEMEKIIANKSDQVTYRTQTKESLPTTSGNEDKSNKNNVLVSKKDVKDAEVSTNSEEYLLSKFEEWKKQEHENYNKEMDKLRNQIMESINTIKEKENLKTTTEPNLIEQLHETIKQQGAEISALKIELMDSKIISEKECADRSKEAETQVAFWANRAEVQSRQYEILLQKLNDVAKDAKESRALAEAERERATQLKKLFQQSLTGKTNVLVENGDIVLTSDNIPNDSEAPKFTPITQTDSHTFEQDPDQNNLEELHRKAQELLHVASISLSSSDTSTVENFTPLKTNNTFTKSFVNEKITNDIVSKPKKINAKKSQVIKKSVPEKTNKMLNGKEPKLKKDKLRSNYVKSLKRKNGSNLIPTSPKRLVRAKITEEVNSRLVSAGVDPLKSRLSQSIFQRQRMHLHQHQELKAKKNPAHDKIRHTILAFLDTNLPVIEKNVGQVPDYISPTKVNTPFKNISSVISNVKTKALSLVKLNGGNSKEKLKPQNVEVAKRAMSLLNTPPGSASTSPITSKRSPLRAFSVKQPYKLNNDENNPKDTPQKLKGSSLNKTLQKTITISRPDEISEESDNNYNNTAVRQTHKTVENLIKSPARRPSSATAAYNHPVQTNIKICDINLLRTQSVTDLKEQSVVRLEVDSSDIINKQISKLSPSKTHNNNDDAGSYAGMQLKKNYFEENLQNSKQTKSVLKNASSTSSLNKKKVLFDMDAIQMKSVSASPSQSLTERSDGNEKYELGLVNLDGEEWDISSIENEPLKNDTKVQNVTRTSPKIAELKEKIESQVARRNETLATVLVGGVDVLAGTATMRKTGSIAGSNTSLGSSILDDSGSVPIVNHKTFVKSKNMTMKDDSDIDISEFSMDCIVNKNESF